MSLKKSSKRKVLQTALFLENTVDIFLKFILEKNLFLILKMWPSPPGKETVSVVSSAPPCKDGNARFTMVPFKALSDQALIIYGYFLDSLNCFYLLFSCEFDLHIISLIRSYREIIGIKHFLSQNNNVIFLIF